MSAGLGQHSWRLVTWTLVTNTEKVDPMGLLKQLLRSKKAAALAAGVVAMLANNFGFDISPETADRIAALFISYLLGQGIADISGKNKPAGLAG